ncbi:Cof-type HAD-IIB family hydrolase [Mesorhizobium sp. M0520]|uniref:Cof-type HAD-IIB family hydrolase n=1 Tax=unclassified Mesorhizobium TaxID=325217 RepID=UPI003335BE62
MTIPRLIVTDVDRTLLTHNHMLPQRVADALGAVREAGITVVLATARSPLGVKPYAERLGVASLVICFNGAWIGDVSTGIAVSEQRIGRADALHAMALAQAAGVRPMWFTGTAIHALAEDPVIVREAGVTNEPLLLADAMEDLPGAPGKIMCVAAQPAGRVAFGALRANLGNRLSVSGSHPRLLEIGPADVSKKVAIATVAAKLRIAAEDCAAAGDAENDLDMLAWAGMAVTVANAVPEVKLLAQFVGPSCDDGGLADAVAWLMQRQCTLATADETGGRNG